MLIGRGYFELVLEGLWCLFIQLYFTTVHLNYFYTHSLYKVYQKKNNLLRYSLLIPQNSCFM